eukprot:TRINITY_DN14036_c0_g1_i1.p1 TRINITY_DN14036_c0_g1~~TRINITY_DN14036_c0_g1_i1.p1  ORF type:complete len:840 (+),score=148.17 TRINITY_DN14036_c0_g1_i1:112-2631(+)
MIFLRQRLVAAILCCFVTTASLALLARSAETDPEAVAPIEQIDLIPSEPLVEDSLPSHALEGPKMKIFGLVEAAVHRNSTCGLSERTNSAGINENTRFSPVPTVSTGPEKKKKELVPLSQWREEKLLELNIKKAKDKQQTNTPNGSIAAVPQQPPAVENSPQVVEPPSAVPADAEAPKVEKNTSNNTIQTSPEAPTVEKPQPANQTSPNSAETAKPDPEPQQKPSKQSHTRKYSRRERHNFASAECGAKTLAANSEAREISAILSSSRDRYMLNPCSAPRKWIVIELCEEVGVEEIMIANFEYFSSMFKEIQILGAAKYPVSHWYLLGNFSANNVREMQNFEIVNSDPVTWIKYIKIRFLTHYGNEFYCPISEIRVYGLTIVEQMHQQLEIDSEDIESLEQVLHHAVGSTLSDEPPSNTPETPSTTSDLPAATTAAESTQPVPPSQGEFSDPEMRYGRVKGQLDPSFDATIRGYVQGVQELRQVSPMEDFDPAAKIPKAAPSANVYEANEEPQPLIPKSLKFTDASDDGGEEEDEEGTAASNVAAGYRPLSSKAMLQVAHLLQKLATRVKSIEVNQSLLAGYLINMTSYFQEELNDARLFHEEQLQTKYSQLYRQYVSAVNTTRQLRSEMMKHFEQLKQKEDRLMNSFKQMEDSLLQKQLQMMQIYAWGAVLSAGVICIILTLVINFASAKSAVNNVIQRASAVLPSPDDAPRQSRLHRLKSFSLLSFSRSQPDSLDSPSSASKPPSPHASLTQSAPPSVSKAATTYHTPRTTQSIDSVQDSSYALTSDEESSATLGDRDDDSVSSSASSSATISFSHIGVGKHKKKKRKGHNRTMSND